VGTSFNRELFKGVRVLVVGDVMLDRYWFGSVDRVSPEAPVPVLAVKRRERRAGGAANVAHNIVALGANCHLLSVIGDDASGDELEDMVKGFGATCDLRRDNTLATTEKLRMVAQNQQLLRADFENEPSDEVLARCLVDFEARLSVADVVVLSDYGKGGLRHVQQMIEMATTKGLPVVVDPKGSDFSRYSGASLITPNRKEFVAVQGEFKTDEELETKARELMSTVGIDSLLVTRSEQGMSFITNDEHTHSPAKAREVYDVSGAGDTVIATIALCLQTKCSPTAMLDIANVAAGIVVAKVGTAVATAEEIDKEFSK